MKPRRTPPRRTFTITIPKDVAEFVEAQYLMIRRKLPEVPITRTDLVLGHFKYGCLSFDLMFSRFDSLVSAAESGSSAPLNREKLKGLFGQECLKELISDAKEARGEWTMTMRGKDVVQDKPVRAVPKPMACVNCKGATVLPSGKPCPSCKPVSAGLRPIPAKKSAKPALRLVKKGTEK